jgi:hypothetical protein
MSDEQSLSDVVIVVNGLGYYLDPKRFCHIRQPGIPGIQDMADMPRLDSTPEPTECAPLQEGV